MVPIKCDLPDPLRFVRRRNQDQTIDSICGYCAKTVATTTDVKTLAEAEASHKCTQHNT
jgi:hypothetical protein